MALALLFTKERQRDVERVNTVVKRCDAFLLMSLVLFAGAARAEVQPLQALQSAAEEFVRARLPSGAAKHFVAAHPLDARLRLTACDSPLESFSSSATLTGARTTVGVRCASPAPWTVYVPVSVEVEVPVLVLKRALARRARVAPTDVEPQVRRVPGSALNFVSDIASLQGHRLKRALPAGAAVTIDALTPDVLVRRGQRVTLIADSGAVQIRAQGYALSDGAADERIRVQNVTSLKVVEGVVESGSSVRVGL